MVLLFGGVTRNLEAGSFMIMHEARGRDVGLGGF
jgi:hypothetical protein